MKINFTEAQLAKVIELIGSKLSISINRAGNIKMVNPNEPLHTHYFFRHKAVRGFWVFYHNESGYLVRRLDGKGYAYPLNMVGRKNVGDPTYYTNDNGKKVKSYYRPYDIKNSYFQSFDDALEYFVNYLKRYRKM